MCRGLDIKTESEDERERTRKLYAVLNSFAMYSDKYVPQTPLNQKPIKELYTKELIHITRSQTYMGIWQVFALSYVLQKPIFSAYRNRGSPVVRQDLHRLILPRVSDRTCVPDDEQLVIMWTSTRLDMKNTHWIPNHFVPVVLHASRSETDERGRNEREEPKAQSATANTRQGVDPPQQSATNDVPLDNECLGHWVLVKYDKKAYPGFVVEVDDGELHVECMNQIGKRKLLLPA